MKTLRIHLNYANVTATIALFVALGMGSAYAAQELAPKSVGAKQLRPGAVTADKLRKKAVTAPKIESLAVKQGKIASSAVTADKIADGAIIASKLPASVIGTEKIADGAVTGEKVVESSLSQVPSAKNADRASFADSSNPEAFAKVGDEATVFPGFSKGIGTADVKQGPEPGIYCINVPGFVPKGAQVTPEYTGLSRVSALVKLATPSCPYPGVEVQIYNNEQRVKQPFFFMAYR
jgi:hypothetical protein